MQTPDPELSASSKKNCGFGLKTYRTCELHQAASRTQLVEKSAQSAMLSRDLRSQLDGVPGFGFTGFRVYRTLEFAQYPLWPRQ